MKIDSLELKVVRFDSEDVIATSLYYAPSAAYNAAFGGSFTSNYVEFNASMIGYDDAAGGWMVTNPYGAKAASDDDIDGLKSGGSYTFPDVGVTVDMSHMAPIAQQAYDAYSYEGGLYTKGATYYELYWQ